MKKKAVGVEDIIVETGFFREYERKKKEALAKAKEEKKSTTKKETNPKK